MLPMPVRVLLESARGANDGGVIAGFCDELHTDRKILVGEATGNGKSGQSAKISGAAEGIWKCEIGFEISFERRCGNWLRRRDQNVEGIKEIGHLLLQDSADLERANVIGGVDLFADIAVDLAERVGELRDFPGADEFAKGGCAFYGNDYAAGVLKWTFGQSCVVCAGKKFADGALGGLQRFFGV